MHVYTDTGAEQLEPHTRVNECETERLKGHVLLNHDSVCLHYEMRVFVCGMGTNKNNPLCNSVPAFIRTRIEILYVMHVLFIALAAVGGKEIMLLVKKKV